MLDKFYEVMFWSGFILSVIAFFYKPLLIFLGVSLMIIPLFREFFKIKKLKKVNFFIKRDFKIHKIILFLVLSGVVVYLLYYFLGLIYSLVFIGFLGIVFLIYKLKNIKKYKLINYKPNINGEKIDAKKTVAVFSSLVVISTVLYIVYYKTGLGYWFYSGIAVVLLTLVIFLFKRKKIKKVIVRRLKSKYETNLDRLLDLVNEKKRVSIKQVAEAFNVKEELAEEWAKILENDRLAVIFYPPVGDVEIRSVK